MSISRGRLYLQVFCGIRSLLLTGKLTMLPALRWTIFSLYLTRFWQQPWTVHIHFCHIKMFPLGFFVFYLGFCCCYCYLFICLWALPIKGFKPNSPNWFSSIRAQSGDWPPAVSTCCCHSHTHLHKIKVTCEGPLHSRDLPQTAFQQKAMPSASWRHLTFQK